MVELEISLIGDFDFGNAWQIRERVSAMLQNLPSRSAASQIVLDLKEVTFMDCAAVRELLRARDLAASTGHRLIIRNAATVAFILRLLGLEFQP